jgi:hypothetical protein
VYPPHVPIEKLDHRISIINAMDSAPNWPIGTPTGPSRPAVFGKSVIQISSAFWDCLPSSALMRSMRFASRPPAGDYLRSNVEAQSDKKHRAESATALVKIEHAVIKWWTEKAYDSHRHHHHSDKA